MNKQNLINWLESNLNNYGFKVQSYADETMLSVYNDSLGMVADINLQTSFITIYECMDMGAVSLVMEFKKQLEQMEGMLA